jgi:hypothetical protein
MLLPEVFVSACPRDTTGLIAIIDEIVTASLRLVLLSCFPSLKLGLGRNCQIQGLQR